MPTLAPRQLRTLARGFGEKQRVVLLLRDELRALEVRFGYRKLAVLASDGAQVPSDFAGGEVVVCLPGERRREIACGAGGRQIAAENLEVGAIHLERDSHLAVADRVGDLRGFIEHPRAVVPALELRVQ